MNTAHKAIEVVPAILRRTFEDIEQDWLNIYHAADHIQIDITDGIFAGDATFRDIARFKKLPLFQKIELHCMVHTPSNYVDSIIDLNPARCIFHLEAFSGTDELTHVYHALAQKTSSEIAIALNPESPVERIKEYRELIDYILLMGYNPGWANQPINPQAFKKVAAAGALFPDLLISVDGHVGKDTVEKYVQAGADILCANTAIFGHGNPPENLAHLKLLAEAAR